MIIVQSPSFFNQYQLKYNKETNAANWFDLGKGFDFKVLFFAECATIIFTYDCQYSLVSVYESLEDKSIIKLYKLNKYGAIIIVSLAIVVAIFGFLTSPTQGLELIIFREDLINYDYFMAIGKFLIGLAITIDIAINQNVVRLCYFEILYNTELFSNRQ